LKHKKPSDKQMMNYVSLA